MNFCTRVLAFVVLFLSVTAVPRLVAVTPVPFAESMSFSFKISGTGAASMNLHDETGSAYVVAYPTGPTIESDTQTAQLRPGKTYTLDMWCGGPTDYWMSFVAPTGYAVYVDGIQTDLVQGTANAGWYLRYYTVELRPVSSEAGGKWGNFSGIALGKSITWEVGLGLLRNGRSAGSILFKELELTNASATRDCLYYAAPPANVGQIVVIRDGPSNQRLRQVVTPVGFTDLVDVTGGYELRFYDWNQVSSWNGILYGFSGSPWKTIKVESPATDQLKITETEGAVDRVSQLTGSGTSGVTGGTITTSGGNTIHTFNASGTLNVGGSSLYGVDFLVVGGGGGGGSDATGGGGGAGSVQYVTGQTLAAGTHSIVVGAGGAADSNGANSTFNGTTGYGGGRGGSSSLSPSAGGSSGGGCANNNTGAPPTTGLLGSNANPGGGGDNGGAGWSGGGGGGAGGNSQNPSTGGGTYDGGAGILNSITGTATYYGGGGGGGYGSRVGGVGGGGNGGAVGAGGSNGTPNTGGGGGGSGVAGAGTGGAGGSGVVIVRYPTANAGTRTWTLQEGDGTTWLRTTVHTSSSPASGQRDVVAVVRTGGTTGTIVAKTKFHYVTQAWGGEELGSVTADPDGAALTTTYAYYSTSSDKGSYRRVKSVTLPTGGWTAYEYYNDWEKRGRLKYQFQPWLDTPAAASSASPSTGRVSYFEYVADWTGRYTRPSLREERINNTLVGKTTWSHGDNTGSGEPRSYATVSSYRDASNYHSDYAEVYRADADPDFAGEPYLTKSASQAQSAASVSRGTYNDTTKVFTVGSTGDHWRELRVHGSTSSAGATLVSSFDGQSFSPTYLVANKSTLEVDIRIGQGLHYRHATYVYDGSGFSLVSYTDFTYDGHGNLTQSWASNGALTNHTYTNGRLVSTQSPEGMESQFTYDSLGRIATSVKKGASSLGAVLTSGYSYPSQGDITTTYTYDGAGRVTQEAVSGGALTLTTSSAFDLAGRRTSLTAPGGYVTSYAYSSGGRIVTATLPGGATDITEAFLDGQPKSLTGTSRVAQYFGHRTDSSGNKVQDHWLNNIGSAAWTAQVWDWSGRPSQNWRMGGNGSYYYEISYYNSAGQLDYVWHSDGKSNHYFQYDTLGQLVREGDDVGANGSLDLASSDRITDHAYYYFTNAGAWYFEKYDSTYASAGSSAATIVAKQNWQLTNLPSGTQSSSYSYDIFGNATLTTVAVDRSNKKVVTTTNTPDSATDAVAVTHNGLAVEARDTAGVTMRYEYDALARQNKSIHPRTGTTTTAFVSGTNLVSTVTDPASIVQATYTYDSAGRVSSVKDALNKYNYTSYTNRNEIYRQWGDSTYPVEYAYDNWGRRTTMSTYRGGSGWTGSTWPASPGTADITTWNYQAATGLLTSKVDAAGKSVDYTYTQAGQIATRQWARILSGSTRVTATYSYSTATRELTGVDYNDSTTDLTYTYNRLGKTATVTDSTGTRTFNYNLSGTLELQSEDLPSYFGSRRVTHPVSTTGMVGRSTGLQLGTAGSPTSEQSVTYGYDTYGRFNSLSAAGVSFGYTYTGNSNLLASIADTGSGWTQTRTYLSNRDLLDVIESKVSTATKARFDYAHDNLGRRTGVAKAGELYSRYGNGTQGLDTTWGYDDRSQVTSEQTKLGGSATVLIGRDDAFAYDNIGNRSSTSGTTHNAATANYTANALNQYTQRSVPGTFDVAGAAGSGATVTVNGSSSGVSRHGEYFFKGHPLSNNPNAAFANLTISDGTTSATLPAFLPATPEAFAYDLDGNLTSDGRWDYTYDAENRLVAM
jgi:YD repeat-containing protein